MKKSRPKHLQLRGTAILVTKENLAKLDRLTESTPLDMVAIERYFGLAAAVKSRGATQRFASL